MKIVSGDKNQITEKRRANLTVTQLEQPGILQQENLLGKPYGYNILLDFHMTGQLCQLCPSLSRPLGQELKAFRQCAGLALMS